MSNQVTIGIDSARLLGIGAVDVVGASDPANPGKPLQLKIDSDRSRGPLRSWPLGFGMIDIGIGAIKDIEAQTDRPCFLHSLVIAPGFVTGGGAFPILEPGLLVKNIVLSGVRCYVSTGSSANPSGMPAGSFRPRGYLPSYLGNLTDNGKAVVTLINNGVLALKSVNAMAFALCPG